VFDASVALVNYVREKSGRHDLDGSGLMTAGFRRTNRPWPSTISRTADSPEMALEYIGLISLLAKRFDRAKRATP